MNKGIVIKNPDNNTYYTGDYQMPWSKNINDAEWYTPNNPLDYLKASIDREEWEAEAFEEVDTLVLINVCNFK